MSGIAKTLPTRGTAQSEAPARGRSCDRSRRIQFWDTIGKDDLRQLVRSTKRRCRRGAERIPADDQQRLRSLAFLGKFPRARPAHTRGFGFQFFEVKIRRAPHSFIVLTWGFLTHLQLFGSPLLKGRDPCPLRSRL